MKIYFAPITLGFSLPTQETLTTSSYNSDWLDHVTPHVIPFTSGGQYDESCSLCQELEFFVYNDCIRSCQAGDTICYKHCNEELISSLEFCCLLDQPVTTPSTTTTSTLVSSAETTIQTTTEDETETTYEPTTEMATSEIATTDTTSTTSTKAASSEVTFPLLTLYCFMNLF